MPFCPECRYEYRENVATCPDCGATLVASLPVGAEEKSGPFDRDKAREDWVEIGNLPSWELSEMVLQGLRAKGIPAVVLSRAGYIGQFGLGDFATLRSAGEYSLRVPNEYAADADKEAELILGDLWEDARASDTG